jgi:hypothetical protein
MRSYVLITCGENNIFGSDYVLYYIVNHNEMVINNRKGHKLNRGSNNING